VQRSAARRRRRRRRRQAAAAAGGGGGGRRRRRQAAAGDGGRRRRQAAAAGEQGTYPPDVLHRFRGDVPLRFAEQLAALAWIGSQGQASEAWCRNAEG
jgi:hypothetical protein